MARHGAAPSHTTDEILDAAISMIDEGGVDAFSIRGLAKQVGLSPMGIYTYFPSREGILKAILDRFIEGQVFSPVPGERWDQTTQRIAGTLFDIVDAHPQMRLVNYELRNAWSRTQYRNVYCIHRDQGMPKQVYVHIYSAFNSFLSGFIDGQVRDYALRRELKATDREPDEWEQIVIHSFSRQSLELGTEAIFSVIRRLATPDPCEWYTPTDPALWTWYPGIAEGPL